jgi:hypothetical protein
MPVEINENVKVGVVFNRGEIRPVWFLWKGRQIRIRETTFTWKTWQGSAPVLHFSVTDGESLYEIIYHTQTFQWMVENAEEK